MKNAGEEKFEVWVNGVSVEAPHGCTVAAAVARAGIDVHRLSVEGHGRGPLCGMGVCMECRVTINGAKHQRGCQTVCTQGMRIETTGVESDD